MKKTLKTLVKPLLLTSIGLSIGWMTVTASARADETPTPETCTAITNTSPESVEKLIPGNGTLREGTYLGKGAGTEREYRLHLMKYLGRCDTFIALMESEENDLAVLGYLVKPEGKRTYQWKQIAVSSSPQRLDPRPTREAMYKVTAINDRRGRIAQIDVTGTNPNVNTEIVHLDQARTLEMYHGPISGQFGDAPDANRSNWTIQLSPAEANDGLWQMEQAWVGQSGNSTETDIARPNLPGVLAVHQAVDKGYKGSPDDGIKWAVIALDHTTSNWPLGRKHLAELIVFKAKFTADENEKDWPGLPDGEGVLVRPATGYRLHYIDPK